MRFHGIRFPPRNIVTNTFIQVAVIAILGTTVAILFTSIRSTVAEIVALNARSAEKTASQRLLRRAQDAVKANAADFAAAESFVLAEGRELDFVNAIENAAPASVSVDISLETVNQAALSKGESEIPVSVRMRGPALDVLATIDRIERLPTSLIAKEVSIHTAGEGQVEAVWSGSVYWIAKKSDANR